MSTIYFILLKCMNIKNVDCDHVASHLGRYTVYSHLKICFEMEINYLAMVIAIKIVKKH
jgi:hypothetical protein